MKSVCTYTKILANSLTHSYAQCFHTAFLVSVAQVKVISNAVLHLYFIKYYLAGITELLLFLCSSNICH